MGWIKKLFAAGQKPQAEMAAAEPATDMPIGAFALPEPVKMPRGVITGWDVANGTDMTVLISPDPLISDQTLAELKKQFHSGGALGPMQDVVVMPPGVSGIFRGPPKPNPEGAARIGDALDRLHEAKTALDNGDSTEALGKLVAGMTILTIFRDVIEPKPVEIPATVDMKLRDAVYLDRYGQRTNLRRRS